MRGIMVWMRIFIFSMLLIGGALSAQVPAPKPKTPLPVKPPAAAASSTPTAQPFDKVVLTVGDEKMTVGEFEKFVDTLPEQYRAQARGPGKRQIVDQLVSLKALAQEARKRKLDQDPAFKAQLAFQAENLLAGTLFRDLSANLKVEDADVRKYYDDHKNEYERVKARHILVRFKGSAAPAGKKELTEEEALEKTKALRARIVAGEDFATIAKAESDDTGSGAQGGSLGTFPHGQMVAPFDQAAFSLPLGQISEPVKSPFGYHIIKVEERTTKSFEEARPEIEKQMKPQLTKEAMDRIKKQLPVTIDDAYFGK